MINRINQKFILNFHIMFHQSEKNYKTIKTKKNHFANGSTLTYLIKHKLKQQSKQQSERDSQDTQRGQICKHGGRQPAQRIVVQQPEYESHTKEGRSKE